MSILIDESKRALVQGITGHQGQFHTKQMKKYGTKILAGVTPGKGGQTIDGIPVYDSIKEAKKSHDVNSSIIFVPAPFVKDSTFEAIDARLDPVVIITEHVPVLDAIEIVNYARKAGVHVIGPNTPGIISPGKCELGIMPSYIFKKGKIGVVSRSGTLTYEIVDSLTKSGLGQSTALGIGGDPVVGLSFIDILNLFEKDKETEAIVLIGEIGGNAEELAASYIKRHIKKPVVAYIAGINAPKGKRMGHAGAVIAGRTGTALSKIKAFEAAGVLVAKLPSEIPELIKYKNLYQL
jgi:succinyl-CoA synthetase alpha subunit